MKITKKQGHGQKTAISKRASPSALCYSAKDDDP